MSRDYGWAFGCGICGETGSGPPGSTPQTCRCEREKAIRAVVEQVAAARGISFAEALQLCIRVLEERFPGDEPPPAAAARKAVGT